MFDVICIGEILLEVSTDVPVSHGIPATLGVSGDALNAAAAAAAAGARTAVIAVIPDDEIGDAITARVRELGISGSLLVRRAGQQGIYVVHGDPEGGRGFAYARTASVGSTLSRSDLTLPALAEAGVVVASGITGAISPSAREAVLVAAGASRRFAYDPNFRPRLTSAAEAAALLDELIPRIFILTPSFPTETFDLLGFGTPDEAADHLRARGVDVVAVTCGAEGVVLRADGIRCRVPSVPAPVVTDQTGAGDSFLGTFVARVALGDSIADAARMGVSAASLAVSTRGGATSVATFEQVRAHAEEGAPWRG